MHCLRMIDNKDIPSDDFSLRCDEKSDMEISIDKEIKEGVIRRAAEDIKFLCDMSQEDLDDSFNPETFSEVNEMVNTRKKPIEINKICSESDQIAMNKNFLPHDEQKRFNNQKYGAKKFVTEANFKKFKRQSYKRYESEIRNGFYTGFVTSMVCFDCESVLGCHPSPYKRIYWVPKERCIYCKKKYTTVTFADLKYLYRMQTTFAQQEYFVDKKYGDKEALSHKILGEHGKKLGKPFEHCWLIHDHD